MTEDEGCSTLIDYAHLRGWEIAHFRPAMTSKGWRTPVSADGAGWPDFVLCRERVVHIEAKVKNRMPTDEQWWWLYRLYEAGAEVYLIWVDEEFDFIVEVLR